MRVPRSCLRLRAGFGNVEPEKGAVVSLAGRRLWVSVRRGVKIKIVVMAGFTVLMGVLVLVLLRSANRLIARELEGRVGKGFTIGAVEVRWGQVKAQKARLADGAGKTMAMVEDVTLKADFMGLLKGAYILDETVLLKPYLLIETDRKGAIVSPVLPAPVAQPTSKGSEKPLILRGIRVAEGSLDILEGQGKRSPVPIRLRDIELSIDNLEVPPADRVASFRLKASIPGKTGTGSIEASGTINLRTRDSRGHIDIRGMDMVPLKPYYENLGTAEITRGFLDLTMDFTVASGKVKAPGKAIVKNLQFETRPGLTGAFAGVPLKGLVAVLKKGNDEIPFTFIVEGDLHDPRFSLKENLARRLTFGLAEQLGLSVGNMGESLVSEGGRSGRKAGEALKDLGEQLKKKIFQ